MSTAWEGEPRLALECELAAAKCPNCGAFGHRLIECPEFTPKKPSVRYQIELVDFRLRLFVFWFVLGFLCGVSAVKVLEAIAR